MFVFAELPLILLPSWQDGQCIQELDLEIKHKPGKHNTNVDTLVPKPNWRTSSRKQTAVTLAVATEQLNGPADVTTQNT